MKIENLILSNAKKITTFDKNKNENGYLMELFKEGDNTLSYLTAINPGCFKGYHLHKVREANYVCIKGKVKIILYDIQNKIKEEIILDSTTPQSLHIPINIATGLENVCDEEVQIINHPKPPYNPRHLEMQEQVEYTKEELEDLLRIKEND